MIIKPCFKSYNGKATTSELDFVYCPKCRTKLVKKEIDGMQRTYCSNCQYIQYLNPLPGVAVLIEKDHKLLLGKRSQGSIKGGMWCLPCGFVEHHESYINAACREIVEETGLKVKITSLVNVSSNLLNHSVHTIVIVLTAKIIDGRLKAGDDLVELEWIDTSANLPKMAFEADKFIITNYFNNALIRIPIDIRFQTGF